MKRIVPTLLAVSVLAALGGCASSPKGPPPAVVHLQGELNRLHSDPRIAPNGGDELRRADAAVDMLAHNSRNMDDRAFDQNVYVAERLVETAEADGLARYAEAHAVELGAERDRLLAESRTRELHSAQATAAAALSAAEIERRNAALARSDAADARDELDQMRGRLTELQTQETERGLVVTLGDVLFEVDRAELKPGAARNLDKLVAALRDNADTSIAIEGHTDSTGNRDYNVDLSERRAEAVAGYLTSHGISSSRITSRGLGPDFPVASNSNEAGRQQNRRVEVVVQNSVALR
jgi:outer membrane protein OmpA-like peptidoglycan-associated protein